MDLLSLSEIFNQRILRIPDYQRGYAWQESQLNDFWNDIYHLGEKQGHYTGVITLDPVPDEVWERWDEDKWLINNKKYDYAPFYVVDGQQRLITSMILLQCILELHGQEGFSADGIKNHYIQFKDEGKKALLFGYEKDNPSHEYLKNQIFGIHSFDYDGEKTLYTKNLFKAKEFFKGKVKNENEQGDVQLVLKKLTENFRYNLFEIKNDEEKEINVSITFKTMNTRGKPLSTLELLKNELIYLSTLIEDQYKSEELRKNINTVWKGIYNFLGKSDKKSLLDDDFLKDHWIMCFQYDRRESKVYEKFLLDKEFTAQKLANLSDERKFNHINDYIKSLRDSVKIWFYIQNPYYPDIEMDGYDGENKKLLDRINRVGFRAFRPLIMTAYVTQQKNNKINCDEVNELLEVIEKYNFVVFYISRCNANTGDSEFYRFASSLYKGKKDISEITDFINSWMKSYLDISAFSKHIHKLYEEHKDGFYVWNGLRYFMYEYEQELRKHGKEPITELHWEILKEHKKNHATIEHILPQDESNDYWQIHYREYNDAKKTLLKHSLGNLLPLSKARNSAFQNKGFDKKKDDGNGDGYCSGSKSEIKVSRMEKWRAEEILERGIDLLKFMETRWDIDLGDDKFKTQLLCLNFSPLVPDEKESDAE